MKPKKRSPKSIIAVDIGNTSATLGLVVCGQVKRRSQIPTPSFTNASIKKEKLFRQKVDAVLIASVVPSKINIAFKALKTIQQAPVKIIGKHLKVPIPNRTLYPNEVGIDRLLNAWETFRRFGRASVAVDFGTATTFDCVSKKGEYLGGIIAPGIELTLNALNEKTALLPRIRLKHPGHVIGRSTQDSISSGCSFGMGHMCDGILNQLSKNLGIKKSIIATGGYAEYMSRYVSRISLIDNDLTLKSIYRLFDETTSQKP